jgi:glycosyltransferase involved in cell wall biosynthesis
MRVAIVSAVTGFHREAERVWRTERLASLLDAAGHEVVVCCARWWTGSADAVEHDGITYRGVTGHPDDRGFGSRLATVLPRVGPDVVHAVHDHPRHVLGAAAGARASRAPLVVDWYDADAPEPDRGGLAGRRQQFDRRLTELAAKAPEAVVAPSRTVATAVRELGADGERTDVVPNPIDVDAIAATDPVDAGDIVYSRRLDGDANLESLLLALAEYREHDWSATVVGDGPARDTYENQVRDLRIDDRVEFTGEVPLDRRIAMFRDAHVYVHTARRAPFATDLCRALACGCVGVAEYHADSAAHELVEQRERGILATDDEELVDCVAAAAEHPHRTLDESFRDYDGEAVRETLLECYADASDRAGLF